MENGSHGAVRRFTGGSRDAGREWKIWAKWARAYVIVQKARGVPAEAVGPLLFTLIDEPALLALDTLEISELAIDGGEEVIFTRLSERYPEPEAADRIGEVLDSIFSLKAARGETTSAYTGRAKMIFMDADKEGISFPSASRGYLILKGMSLSRDQKAVVLAASKRSYAEPDITSALRTTYPTTVPEKSAFVVREEEGEEAMFGDDEVGELEEIEMLLTVNEDEEPIEEEQAIETLATWKQQRVAISKEKLSRGFRPEKPDLNKLRKRVRCFDCKKIGHFSKDCPNKKKGGNSGGKGAKGSSSFMVLNLRDAYRGGCDCGCDHDQDGDEAIPVLMIDDASDDLEIDALLEMHEARSAVKLDGVTVPVGDKIVELNHEDIEKDVLGVDEDDEIEAILSDWQDNQLGQSEVLIQTDGKVNIPKMVRLAKMERLRREQEAEEDEDDSEVEIPVHFREVHRAGQAVVDTGCGRAIIGEDNLNPLREALSATGETVEEIVMDSPAKFRYGDGSVNSAKALVVVPWKVGKYKILLRVHVVPGGTPFLMSKPAMKMLGAIINTVNDSMTLTTIDTVVPMTESRSGHYLIDLAPLDHQQVKNPDVKVVKVSFDGEQDFREGRVATQRLLRKSKPHKAF